MRKSTISMAIFHSYFDITRGYRYRSYGLHWHMTCGKVERSHRAFKMMVNFVPSGKRLRNWWERSTILMGKSTISMAIFNSHVNVYQRVGVWTIIGVQPDRSDRVGPLQQLLGKAKDTSLWTWLQPQPQPRPKRLRHPRAWLSKPLVALTLHNTCPSSRSNSKPPNTSFKALAVSMPYGPLGAEVKASSWPRWSSASPCWTGAGALRPIPLA